MSPWSSLRSRLEGAVRRRAITVGSSDSSRSIGSPVQAQRSTTARSFEIETIRQLPPESVQFSTFSSRCWPWVSGVIGGSD